MRQHGQRDESCGPGHGLANDPLFHDSATAYTIKRYLELMGDRLTAPIVPAAYSENIRGEAGQPATYIFTDLERVPPAGLERLSKIWKRLESAGDNCLLNHPTRAMRRYELLRTLYEAGINEFNVYRLTEARRPRTAIRCLSGARTSIAGLPHGCSIAKSSSTKSCGPSSARASCATI